MGRASRRKRDGRGRPACLHCARRFDPAEPYPNLWRQPRQVHNGRAVWCQRCVSAALVRGAVAGVYDRADAAVQLDALFALFEEEEAS